MSSLGFFGGNNRYILFEPPLAWKRQTGEARGSHPAELIRAWELFPGIAGGLGSTVRGGAAV